MQPSFGDAQRGHGPWLCLAEPCHGLGPFLLDQAVEKPQNLKKIPFSQLGQTNTQETQGLQAWSNIRVLSNDLWLTDEKYI